MSDSGPGEPDPRLLSLLADYPPGLFDRTLYQSLGWVHRYTLAHVADILRRLGALDPLARGATADELAHALRFSPRFRPALCWLLAYAAAEEVLDRDPGGASQDTWRYRAPRPLPVVALDRLRAEGIAIDPGNARTATLLDAAAEAYPDIACGARSGEEALLGPAGIGLWLDFFHNDNRLYAVINRIAALAAIRRLPTVGRVRILELGAGAGSGSDALLAALKESGVAVPLEDVLVTEPNALFRRRAERALRARHAGLPLRFDTLDIDRDWVDQGVATGSFDLIFAVNVLHVARDLPGALRRLRESLAPGGLLVAGECIRPYPGQPVYIELAFSLLASFTQVGTDPALRPEVGFLAPEHWRALLMAAGFAEVTMTPDPLRIRPTYSRLSAAAICARRI